MNSPPQTYANHAKFAPIYHFGVVPILLLNFGWTIWQLFRGVTFERVLDLLVALALLGLAYSTREFALTIQNRIIRQEMWLRLARVLPPDLAARIPELKTGQLIALRFASDAELPDLLRQVLGGELRRQREIKRRIKDWQADHLRC